jgi:acyl dehydratase
MLMVAKYRYVEDYEVGQTGITRARTVGEPEIVNFACITCDYSSVHVDHHANVDGPYGGRIAHGLLGTSLAAGLLSLDAPHLVGRGVSGGFLHGFDANYRDAIRLGETIRIAWENVDTRDDQEGYGIVRSDFQVLNQEDKPVYDGHFLTKVQKRATGQEGARSLAIGSPTPWEIEDFCHEPEKIYNLEDFNVGEGGMTSGRTITEADIINFAGLTGDYNPLYVDDHYARNGPFEGRIVPGLFVFDMAFGLWMRDAGVTRARSGDTSKIAGHLNDSAVFYRPVKIGDTIRCLYKIEETRVSRTKPHIGIIRYGFQLLNQRDEVVQEGKTLMLRSTSRVM